jgi:hypothetical protein
VQFWLAAISAMHLLRLEAILTGIVSYLNGATATIGLAKAKDAKCYAIEGAELDWLDDWRRKN